MGYKILFSPTKIFYSPNTAIAGVRAQSRCLPLFLYGAATFLSFQQEFLALIFVIVYVGAIAILYLFLVMMLDLKSTHEDDDFEDSEYDVDPFLLYVIIQACAIYFVVFYVIDEKKIQIETEVYLIELSSEIDNFSDLYGIGQILYDFLSFSFILAGFLLLVAMVGAIGLTLKSKWQPQTFNLSRGNSLAPITPKRKS